MTKVGDQCEKREKTIKRLNSLAVDVDIAGKRVKGAEAAYSTLIEAREVEATRLREEMEAKLQARLDALHKDANSAKSELGTARQVFRDVEQKYRLTLAKMRTLLGDAEAEHEEHEDDADDEGGPPEDTDVGAMNMDAELKMDPLLGADCSG